jgi:hypothetical protein
MVRTRAFAPVSRLTGLPPSLRNLIASSIDSIEALEILLLLRRSPQTFWATRAIAEQLGIAEEIVVTKLGGLRRAGLVSVGDQTGAYRYAPHDEELSASIADLATAYHERRASVVNTIFSANLERLRAFSDAFKVTK